MTKLNYDPDAGANYKGKRVRQLTYWTVEEIPENYKGPTNCGYWLKGIVSSEADGPPKNKDFEAADESFMRFTKTSPVAYRVEMTVYTETGSEYTLLTPAPWGDPDGYIKIPERTNENQS